jgi:hypothetical protein
MPAFLDRRDSWYVLGAFALMAVLLGLTYALGPAPAQSSIGSPTIYSPEWAGVRGAYLLLKNQGYDVRVWEKSPEDLPEDAAGALWVIVEPYESGTSTEAAAIRRFVSNGGRVLAVGADAASLLPDFDAAGAPEYDPQEKIFSALFPSPITLDAPEITMVSPDSFTSSKHGWLGLYGDKDRLAVVAYRLGRGEVIWWAADSPMMNGMIREKNNLEFFLNCIGPRETTRVYWDEYFHGSRASFWSYFANGPLPWAGWQLAVAFLAVMFTFSRRSGAVRLPAAESRLSPLEFVDTLGDLYQSAHASPAAVAVAYHRFRTAVVRKLALSPRVKLPEMSRAASARFGWPQDDLLDTLARSERAMRNINLHEDEALYLVRQLHEYSARLEPKGRPDQEAPAWR